MSQSMMRDGVMLVKMRCFVWNMTEGNRAGQDEKRQSGMALVAMR